MQFSWFLLGKGGDKSAKKADKEHFAKKLFWKMI